MAMAYRCAQILIGIPALPGIEAVTWSMPCAFVEIY